ADRKEFGYPRRGLSFEEAHRVRTARRGTELCLGRSGGASACILAELDALLDGEVRHSEWRGVWSLRHIHRPLRSWLKYRFGASPSCTAVRCDGRCAKVSNL